MSVPQRVHGVRVLKAVSSPLRLQILNYLFDKGPLSYTELMNSIKLSPTRDAGRFAYHLKFLLRTDLIEADIETKKYCLTELGKTVIEVADKIERRSSKPREVLVRTSRFALEEFDANKITNSLVREAKVPADLAQKVAKEAEKELLKSKPKYITAPLVRELVNAILVERGLEEYRHKLTRLGLPVQEVTQLIEARTDHPQAADDIERAAGKAVMNEYVLLNVFPRALADAYMSGAMYVDDLDSWVLKPSEIVHDLRYFLQKGLDLEKVDPSNTSCSPPQDLESALSTVLNVLSNSAKEVQSTQTLEYFNLFLAPYARGVESSRCREQLRLFLTNAAQIAKATLCLELTVPSFMAKKAAAARQDAKGKIPYSEFSEETQALASLIIEVFEEETASKPLFNPSLVVKIRSESFQDPRAKAILLKAHTLAAKRSIPFFANLVPKLRSQAAFSGSGFTLSTDRTKDWEVDTLRTGCLGTVTINLPRAAYECQSDKGKFIGLLKERIELALNAFEIKYQALRHHGKGLLPFLMQSSNGDHYFRFENCSGNVNLAGLGEAGKALVGKSVDDARAREILKETMAELGEFVTHLGKRHGRRLSLTILPDAEASRRLVELDIERYGFAKVKFCGTRENPYYSTVNKLAFSEGNISAGSLVEDQVLNSVVTGLSLVDLGDTEHDQGRLLDLTEKITTSDDAVMFAYYRCFSYCINCRKTSFGWLPKCPSCGSVGSLVRTDRYGSV